MLHLYEKNTINFTNNGEPIRHSYEEHVIREEGFYLTFKLLLDKNSDYKKIKKEMIISAETPDGRNQFRVYDIVKRKDHVEVVAIQLMYDLDNKMVNPFKVTNVSGTTIINRFVSAFKSTLVPFTLSSSVTETHDFTTNDADDNTPSHNALEVLNRITNRWDSELMLNGFDIRIVKRLGTRTNALLYEKKNISEFEDESSVRGMTTRIHATSRFTAEGDEDETVISVTVDSPLINEYAQIYEKSFVNNDARTTQELINWVKLKYSTENIDKPKRTISVSTNIIDGTEINYGDDLVLKYLLHDVDEVIRCVGYDYNPVAQTYYSITLGDWKDSFATTLTGGIVDTTQRQINQIKKNVTHILMNADGYHRNAYGPDPVPNPINGDIWYYFEWDRPNEIEMRIFEDGFWVPIPFGTKAEVDAAIEQAEEAKKEAEQAYADAVTEAERLVEEQSEAFDAKLEAETSTIRDEITTGINDAITNANNYTDAQLSAFDTEFENVTSDIRNEMEQGYADAVTNAKSYTDTQKQVVDAQINLVKGEVVSAKNAADSAVNSINTAIANAGFSSLDDTLKNITAIGNQAKADAQIGIANAATALSQAQSAISQLGGLSGKITSVEQDIDDINGVLSTKVSTTDFNSLTGTVTNLSTTQTQQAGLIAQKANQSTVDTLTGRVTTAEGQISTQAGQIALRVTEVQAKSIADSAVDSLEIGVRNLVITYNQIEGKWLHTNGNETTGDNHAIMSDLIAVTPNEILTFTKINSSIVGNPSFWRWNWYDSTKTYINRSSNSSNEFQWAVPSNAYYIRVSYPMDSLPKVAKGNKATDWSPAPEDTMELISSVSAELKVEKDNITALTTRVSGTETLITQVKQTAEGTATTVSDHTGRITSVEQNVNGLQSTVNDPTTGLSTKYNQLASGFNQVVIDNKSAYTEKNAQNLFIAKSAKYGYWRETDFVVAVDMISSDFIKVSPSERVTLSWYGIPHANWHHRVQFYTIEKKYISRLTASYVDSSVWTLTVPSNAHYIIVSPNMDYPYKFNYKVQRGGADTGNTIAPEDEIETSIITQLSDQINLRVTKGELLSQINVQADNILIQTNKLYLDVNSVHMTTAYINDIKAKSLEAVNADITNLRAKILVADVVTATHLKVDNALIDALTVSTAIVDRFYSKTAVINNLTARTLSAITANITSIRSQIIVTDSIVATHLKVDNALIDKLTATTAVVDRFFSKTAVIDNITTKTLTAVTANITSIRSQVLVANVVEATHLKADTALVNKLFATTALIETLTSKTAFINSIKAIDISADRITAGTLNAANVNIINLNVSKIVGLNSAFVQSAWNGISTQIGIDSTAITASDSAGNQAIINASGEIRSTAGGTDQTRGIFHKGRLWFHTTSGSAVLNIGAHPVVGEGVNRGSIATARAEKLVIGRYNDYLTTNINAKVNPYITLEYGATLGDESNAFTKVWHDLSMSGKFINDVQQVSGFELAVRATSGRLMLGVTGYNTLQVGNANTRSFGNIEMQPGYSVTNASDARWKNIVGNTAISALSEIRRLTFVDYYWKQGIQEKQFGLIAQHTPFLAVVNEDGYYSLDNTKQVMLNSLGIKELDSNVINLADRVNLMDHRFADEINEVRTISNNALTKTQELEKRIEELEEEIELLKSA